LHRDSECFGEFRLGPAFRDAKFGDPAPNVAHDLIRGPLSHVRGGSRIGLNEKARDWM
jgi:hypothetical protein